MLYKKENTLSRVNFFKKGITMNFSKYVLVVSLFFGSQNIFGDKCCNFKPFEVKSPTPPNVTSPFVEALKLKYCAPFFPTPETTSECLSKVTILRQENFNPATGVVITEPGVYCLFENINWDPAQDFLPAITVKASGVVIHGNDHAIKGNPRLDRQNIIGIFVADNLKDILINNVTVTGMSLFGIQVSDGVDRIAIENVNASENGMIGDLNKPRRGGIIINRATNVIVKNCSCNQNISNFVAFGARVTNSDNIQVINCSFNENYGQDNSFGLSGLADINLTVLNCQCNKNGVKNSALSSLTGRDGAGAHFLTSLKNFVIRNCTFNDNVADVNCWGAVIISRTDDGAFISDCVFNGNQGFAQVRGAEIDVNRLTMFNCQFSNSLQTDAAGTGRGTAVGLQVQGLRDVVVKDCVAQNIVSRRNPVLSGAPSSASGFLFVSGVGHMVIENCVAQEISGPGNVSEGFRFVPQQGVLFKNCKAMNVTNTNTATPSTFNGQLRAAGFALEGSAFDLQNCVAENVTFPNIKERGIGFLFRNAERSSITECIAQACGRGILVGVPEPLTVNPGSRNIIVRNNLIENNTEAGIVDTTSAANKATNAYYANQAKKNGTTPATTNYVGLPAGAPIQTWTSAALPPSPVSPAGPAIDNISILY